MVVSPFAVIAAENSQHQRTGLLLYRRRCRRKARISAAVAGLPAVSSLYLTATSANRGSLWPV